MFGFVQIDGDVDLISIFTHGAGFKISRLFSFRNFATFKMTRSDRPAPFKNYLHVYDCRTGEDYFTEIEDDESLDIEEQVLNWVEARFSGELLMDSSIMHGLEGDFYATIKTDFTSPDSVICWSGGGFYLKGVF